MNNIELELEAELQINNEGMAEDESYVIEAMQDDALNNVLQETKEQFLQEASNAEDKLNVSAGVNVFYPVEMVYKSETLKSVFLYEEKAVSDPSAVKKYTTEGITDGYKITVFFYSKTEASIFIEKMKDKINKVQNNETVSGIETTLVDLPQPEPEIIITESKEDGVSPSFVISDSDLQDGKVIDIQDDQNNNESTSTKTQNTDKPQNSEEIQVEKSKKSYSLGKVKTVCMAIVAVLVLWYCGAFDFMSFFPKKETTPPPPAGKYSSAVVPEEQQAEAEKAKEEQGSGFSRLTGFFEKDKITSNGDPLSQTQGSSDNTQIQSNGQNAGQGTSQGQLTPESGGTDVSQDPIYQQRMAMRQAYLELAKQAFISKPTVEGGNWAQQNNTSSGQQKQEGINANNPFAELDNAIQKAKQDAANAAQRAIENAGGQGAVNSNSNSNSAAGTGNSAQNGLSNKEAFFNSRSSGRGYLGNTRTEKISPYTLPSGSMIPCALISGINSDLPGNITASVTENVFDWSNAHVCVIPQGTRIFGEYNSAISWGQKRVQVSWQRLIFPDGSTLDLGGMPGVDRRGFTGVKDKYYGHYGKMAIAALLTTGFTILPAIVEGHFRNDGVNVNYGYGTSAYQTAASAAAQQIGSMGNRFFNKSLNQQPTVLVRPGTRFNIQVNADIPFYKAWSIAHTTRR